MQRKKNSNPSIKNDLPTFDDLLTAHLKMAEHHKKLAEQNHELINKFLEAQKRKSIAKMDMKVIIKTPIRVNSIHLNTLINFLVEHQQ